MIKINFSTQKDMTEGEEDVTFSDRDHGHNTDYPGHEAEDEHRDNLGGEEHLFHDDGL